MATSSTFRYSKASDKCYPWRELDPMLKTMLTHHNTFTSGVSTRIQDVTGLLIYGRRTYNDEVLPVLELCSRLVPLLEAHLANDAAKDDDQVLSDLLLKGQSELPKRMKAIDNTSVALKKATDKLPELKQALAHLGRPVRETSKSSNWAVFVFEKLSNQLETDTLVWEAMTLCCTGAADSIKSVTAAVEDEKKDLDTLAEAFKTAHFRYAWHRNDDSGTHYASWVGEAVEKLRAHSKNYLSRHNVH